MNIRWSPEAAVDFAGIIEYTRTQNPAAADRIARTIYESIASLESFPRRSRPSRRHSRIGSSSPAFHRCLSDQEEHCRSCPSAPRLTTLVLGKPLERGEVRP